MANTLFDLYLGDVTALQGYRCNAYVRDSAPLIAAKFSTGSGGQTDLDLLKSQSVDNVSGGMFQREQIDSTRVARAVGVYNPYDENLYPALPPQTVATGLTSQYVTAKAESDTYSFIALGYFSAGMYYNSLRKITYVNGYQTITLPTELQNNGFNNINAMTIYKRYLFVTTRASSGVGPTTWRYDIPNNSWVNIGGYLNRFFSIRGQLYAIGLDNNIPVVTNEESGAATYTVVANAGNTDMSSQAYDAVEFNGAAWIAKQEGIYRFDGVACVRVLRLFTTQLCEWNGALYFFSGLYLYRFDGTNVTKLQYFGTQERGVGAYVTTISLASDSDYLYLGTAVLTSAYAGGDKVLPTASGLRRIYSYDGAAFVMLQEKAETFGGNWSTGLVTNYKYLYDVWGNIVDGGAGGQWETNIYKFALDGRTDATAVTTSSKLEITTSEFDDGYPNIFKSLEGIEPMYSGLKPGDVLTASFRTNDGKTWSSWQTAGTLSSTSDGFIELTAAAQKLFKRMQINITITPVAGSTATLRGVSWRYTLQPRARWRWQIGLLGAGNGFTVDRNNSPITTDSNAIQNGVLKSVKQKTPLFMLAPDYGLVKTSVNNAALSFIVKGQVAIDSDPYLEYKLCAVKNNAGVWEVLRVSSVVYNAGLDETTITVLERGYYGVTPGTINANAEWHPAHKVFVTRLVRETTDLNEETYNEQTSGESQLQRNYQLEVVEV